MNDQFIMCQLPSALIIEQKRRYFLSLRMKYVLFLSDKYLSTCTVSYVVEVFPRPRQGISNHKEPGRKFQKRLLQVNVLAWKDAQLAIYFVKILSYLTNLPFRNVTDSARSSRH